MFRHVEQEAAPEAVSTELIECTGSMQRPEQAPASLLTLEQNNRQDPEYLTGQALALSLEEVHALGSELCSKVRLLL